MVTAIGMVTCGVPALLVTATTGATLPAAVGVQLSTPEPGSIVIPAGPETSEQGVARGVVDVEDLGRDRLVDEPEGGTAVGREIVARIRQATVVGKVNETGALTAPGLPVASNAWTVRSRSPGQPGQGQRRRRGAER